MATIVQTDRLTLREMALEDSAFILELLNDPDWIRFIGDKGVNTLADARDYILSGPMQMIQRLGFGLYLVARRSDAAPIGICGLIKRDTLDDVDLGFAFLPAFRSLGYAREAAEATIDHGRDAFGLRRIVAIVSPQNPACVRLLAGLGFTQEGIISPAPKNEPLCLFARPC